MKKQELKSLIKESLQEVMSEMGLTSESQARDPEKEEMMQFLQQQFGRYDEEGFEDSAEIAIYWFANDYHGGQSSNLYSILSTSPFNPGPISRGPAEGSMEEMMYQALESEFGGNESSHSGEEETMQEDGAAGVGGGPGPGGMSTTSNVQGYNTPKAFSRKKGVQETGNKSNDDSALYVQYDSERQGEEPFMMNGQKFQYVNAIYPSGKKDIGVYAFAGDMVYGYDAFRQRMGIKEEEQPEQYDAETDQFAPGPRQRPEDWKPEVTPQIPINESVPKRILKLKDLLKKKKK